MSNGLKNRIERIQDQLRPEVQRMIVVIVTCLTAITDPAKGKTSQHYLGKYATCCFIGGTPAEQRRALKRLRASGEYDRPPHEQLAIGQGTGRGFCRVPRFSR
jgi:hypothetical protein